MDPNAQKEQFSNAFISAITSVSECSLCKPSVDDDSIDWTINKVIPGRPKLDVQLKCTSTDSGAADFPFFVRAKNYNDLRLTDLIVPRLLIVVVVPVIVNEWLDCDHTSVTLRHRGYWQSLRGFAAPASESGETVHIPRTQLFTVEALNGFMATIAAGGLL